LGSNVSRTRCGTQYRFAEPGPNVISVGPGSAAHPPQKAARCAASGARTLL